eukprot:CAMPEP_0204215178 /NCGR_PEP_ID=MMETSP0361-20130328/77256_1 /ASSEMBLY_ACC=CAM_ASM_000343 /TAXON_ID=268821 /ORGANISM="Scrippsiella Hangoei, Strain SHTV-5" /LENGTH=89 /DNA_ID=CAMNT_0051179885 /DNA_START=117 /DNA_END=383 /DNA_ORIENTATION=+
MPDGRLLIWHNYANMPHRGHYRRDWTDNWRWSLVRLPPPPDHITAEHSETQSEEEGNHHDDANLELVVARLSQLRLRLLRDGRCRRRKY